MLKKILNGFLIVFALAIYGGIFFKLFNKKDSNTSTYDDSFLYSSQTVDFNKKRDSFHLVLNDRDPFGISNRVKRNIAMVNSNNKTVGKKKREDKPTVWPPISYYGFVKGESKDTKLVLIKIGNNLSRLRENESMSDVKIVKAHSDSILVSFNKQLKIIKKIDEKI